MDKKLRSVLDLKPHFFMSDSIPLYAISQDGVIKVAKHLFSKTYKINDVNFGIAKDDERASIVNKWARLLRSLNPAYDMQLCIYNHTVDIDYLSDTVLMNDKNDELDTLRNEINSVIRKNMTAGNNEIKRDIYITLTVPSKNITSASTSFAQVEHDIISILRTIPGCSATPLTPIKRLNLLHDIFHGCHETEMSAYNDANRLKADSFSLENLYRYGGSPIDLIQPDSMEYRVDYFKLGNQYGRAFNLSDLASVVNDTFLIDFTTMPFNMLFTINIHQLDPVTGFNLVRSQRTNAAGQMADVMKRASQSGYDAVLANPDLAKNFNDFDQLLEDMERRDQKLFDTKFHVVVFADDMNELKVNSNAFITRCRTRSVVFQAAYGLQENTFLSSIPLGIDRTPKTRTLHTAALSVLVPFSSQEMTQRGGTAYGINKVTHNIITFNRMLADSYNMLTLGFTGSGKSFFAKKEILSTYLNGNNADVIIIDPQAEYGKLVKAVGGEEILIKSAGDHHVNPMDISASYGTNPIAEKQDFLQSIMSQMLNHMPDPVQRTAISIATVRCYDAWKKSGDDKDIPTLETFYEELWNYYNANNEALPTIMDLIKAVEFYVEGTTTLFKGKTNVDTGSSFISFNIADLTESTRPLAMMVILDSILNRMSRNRKLNRTTYVYIDEIHLLFKDDQTAEWIKTLWKTARKYKCAPCGITQDCEDILSSEVGRAVLTNTSFVVLLKQASINAKVLAKQLQLSDRQLDFVTDTPPGEGLLYIQNSSRFTGGVLPFEDHVSEDSLLYKICQTSSNEQ